MTFATFVHGVFGVVALLLFLEARSHGRRSANAARHRRSDTTSEWDFHPELLVRWDDETRRGSHRSCERDPVAEARTSRRRRLTRTADRTSEAA